jgi:hypothetical protein
VIDVLFPSASIVAVTEAQQTQRVLTALVALLVVVALLLALLTLWYWRHTSPKRRMRRYAAHVERVAATGAYDPGFDRSGYADPSYGEIHNEGHRIVEPRYAAPTMVDVDGTPREEPYREASHHYYR